ncbi:hotdog fold thioesterase [Streptomyces sp. BG9H]|uniref:Hotdog fold thioesterase n=1 Tax=Streptomyces anatolicus TaxID=2675858 RepID=A0ABS6YJ57_9ACTN|nr:PaaI family thioesterase [Streptomyces anatolicus]MBW5421125.1 hotdog fold thioesterase [Streptomyces anatolicus]
MSDTLAQNDPRAHLLSLVPFAGHLGITFEEAGPDRVEGTLPWSPELCTVGGVLHGGAVMTLADTVGAVCAFLNLPEGAATSTIESKTNFLRAVRSGTARAVARPLHIGGSFIVVQTEMYDDQGRLTGQTTQTQAVLGARS